ncbi:transcriptional regulator GlxA family with amidase domain [Trinickia symbiotica]|uniref:AraC family transcriptional regulator n=1 Tax=Trinickia symbiotica TaxID=863227 RepID=A0A2N7X1N5_9BURK|nr:helix-turn-helix domain-containing protein [Trinickia symbiotica]PMS35395.1 AraC family transcriptional regulator [Trinickia symbiotica]PPK45414.1 transcriptional regulator GlxA family with amidase domain [Trinickia symbiotica]
MAKRIAILIFDAFSLVEVSSVAEVFRLADEIELEHETALKESDAPMATAHSSPPEPPPLPESPEHFESTEPHEPYELIVVSDAGGSVASSGAMRVWSERLETYASGGFDVLFIAGGPGAARAKEDESFMHHLREALQHTRVVKPIGEGFGILAAANATQGTEAGAQPNVPIALGVAARTAPLVEQAVALDDPLGPIAAALSIVKRDRGANAAREISERSMPGAWRRLGAVLGELDEGGAREKINAAARWMRENYGRPISVAKAAQVAAMSERSFLRRFKSQMGLTPSEYLLRARLDASCLLLVATDLPVDKIARRCGVSSGDGLAKIFRKRLSISPTEYRIAERRRANQR